MFQRMSCRWILTLAFGASVAFNSVASAQIGLGFGRGGYGGIYGLGPNGGIYNGYGGFGGFGGFGPGIYPGYGFGSPGFGMGNFGYGYGFGNGFSYAQPIYSTYNQPLYSTRVFTPQIYTLRTFTPLNASGLTYSGSSSGMTSSAPVVINIPRNLSIAPRLPSNLGTSSQGWASQTTPPQGTHDNGEIILFSPPTNTRDVKYSLNGASYTMRPGTVQKFTNDRTWVIEANLGNGLNTKYTLSTGRYKFRQLENGMNLFTTNDRPEVASPSPEPVDPPAAEVVPPAPVAPVPMPDE